MARALYREILPYLEWELGPWHIDAGDFHFDFTRLQFGPDSVREIDSTVTVFFEEATFESTIKGIVKNDDRAFTLWTTASHPHDHCQLHRRLLVQRAKDPWREVAVVPRTMVRWHPL